MSILRERFSFVIAVVITGVVTAVVSGHGLLAVGVGLGFGLFFVWITGRGRPSAPNESEADQPLVELKPYSFEYEWNTPKQPDLEAISDALSQLELRSDPETAPATNSVVLRGGSQLWTRLRGGYYVAPRRLPVKAELSVEANGAGHQCTLKLKVFDTLGFSLRDAKLKERYAEAASDIKNIVEQHVASPSAQR
jgi:hypothetical protein